MSPGRLLMLFVFPAAAGVWIFISVDGVLETTPPVGASNDWGQHTPRPRPLVGPVRGAEQAPIRANVPADFNPEVESPRVAKTTFLDRMASVIGHVEIGERVYVAPFASIRGDEGQPIRIGSESNVQDGVVIHALETFASGVPVAENTYEIDGRPYAVYVGNRVSLAHQSQVHGPAWIEDDVFVGMQALVFRAHIGKGAILEPAVKVIGVNVPAGRYVPAGSVVTSQAAADALPQISFSYGLRELNRASVHVNTRLADGYSGHAPAAPEQ